MPKNSVADWSTTAASNADIGGIDIDENCAAAGINNAIREMMAQVRTVITPWVTYTPTFTGFGTAASIAFRSRRNGPNLEIIGRFAAGTATATEARISLGFNGVDGGIAVSSILNSAIWAVGTGAFTIVGAAQCFAIVTGGQDYLKLGLQSASREGLTPVNGNVALPTSGNVLAITASIPIEGW